MADADIEESLAIDSDVWYFAYGSNLNAAVFTGKRGIKPKATKIAFLPEYELCFNVLFMPYIDPAMAGLKKKRNGNMCVYGVQYLLTCEDFRKMVISEGGSVAYKVTEVESKILLENKSCNVYTLVPRRDLSFAKERSPSERYIALLIQGAYKQNLPDFYQKQLQDHPVFRPLKSARWRMGSWLFNLIWQRISIRVQRGTRQCSDENGNVPRWFLLIFDVLLWAMWIHHDFLLAPIFGRGDGR